MNSIDISFYVTLFYCALNGLSVSAQKCYLLDYSQTEFSQPDGTSLDSLTTLAMVRAYGLRPNVTLTKNYALYKSASKTHFIVFKTGDHFTSDHDLAEPFVTEEADGASIKKPTPYTDGDFVGNVSGQFCREAIIAEGDKTTSVIYAPSLPFFDVMNLGNDLPGLPMRYLSKGPLEYPNSLIQITHKVIKISKPEYFISAIEKYKKESQGHAYKDDCPEAGMRFIELSPEITRTINAKLIRHLYEYISPANLMYELPQLNGPVKSLEIRNGDRREKTVSYNDNFQPLKLIDYGYAGSDIDTIELQISANDKILGVTSNNPKNRMRNDTLFKSDFHKAVHYNPSSKVLASYVARFITYPGRKNNYNERYKLEKNYNKDPDVYLYNSDYLVTHSGTGVTKITKELKSPHDCRFVKKYTYSDAGRLINIYDVTDDKPYASYSYYDNGLLRSHHDAKLLSTPSYKEMCFRYTIRKLEDEEIELSVSVDYFYGDEETTIYRIDHYGNIIYRGSPVTNKNGQRRSKWYLIEYADNSSNHKTPDR